MEETLTCGCIYSEGTLVKSCNLHGNLKPGETMKINPWELLDQAQTQEKKLRERLAALKAFNAQARKALDNAADWIRGADERQGQPGFPCSLIDDINRLLSSTPKLPDLEAADELVEKWLEISPNITHVPGGLAPQMDALTQRWLASRGQIPEKEGQDGAYKP